MAKLDPKLTAQIKRDLKEINDFYKKIGAQPLEINVDTANIDDFKLIKEYLKEAREESDLLFGSFRDVKAEVDEIFSGLNSITDEIKNGRQGFDLTKSAVAKLTTVMGQVKDIQDDITNANTDDLRKLQQKALAERKNLVEAQRLLKMHENINDETSREYIALQNINGLLADQDGLFGEIDKTLKQVVKNSEIVDKNFGFKAFDNISQAMGDIPGLGKLSKPLQEASGAAKSMAEGIESAAASGGKGLTKEKIKQLGLDKKLGNLSGSAAAQKLKGMSGMQKGMMALQAGFKSLGPTIAKAFGPVYLITEAIKAIMTIDKASGEVAKSMGISAKEARVMNAEMADAAANSKDLLVSSQDVVKANMQLNKIMGTGAQFSAEMAVEFASISEKTGLSEAAMKKFAEGSIIGGKTIKDQLVDVTAITQELNAQNKVSFAAKDIQEGIAQLSKAQQLSAGMNTKEMAKQVFQQKLLGLNAQQMEGVQSSLLNFESSIAAEMEAELLTGKQLNLENARAAALAGDQATLAAEIRKEVGTAEQFSGMNVMQQEALAKAMGMTREDMAGMLIEQEKLAAMQKAFGGDIKTASEAQAEFNRLSAAGELTEEKKKELAEAGVLAQLESASAQDKLNAMMEKMSDLFIQIMDPLMPIIDTIMAILEPIFALLGPITKVIGDLVGLVMQVLTPALDLLMAVLQPIFNVIEMLVDVIGGSLGNVIESITSMFSGVGDIIMGIVTMDFSMILDGFKSIARGAIGLLLSPIQAVVDLIVGTINLVIRGLNYVPGVDISELESPDLAGLVGGLVGLADGGIVPATPGGVPALIGEGGEDEVVMPLSRLSDLIPGMGGLMGAAGGIMDTVGSFFGGEDEDVTQLKELNKKISKLIAVVEKGGDVKIDGNKVGKSMALATSNIG